MEIRFLQAEYGDAIIIKTMTKGEPFTIVVDGGPYGTSDEIARIYQELGKINLMILTHFDEDHIKGIIKYVELFKGNRLPVERFWCNCAQEVDLTSDGEIANSRYENANTLAEYLREQKYINGDFEWTEDIFNTIAPFVQNDLRIDVLSPSKDTLEKLKEDYEEYVKQNQWKDNQDEGDDGEGGKEIALVNYNPDAKKSIDELAQKDTTRSVNLWNEASIAFLLQAEGKKLLMLGDADADVIADSLEKLIGKGKVIELDLVKLSHHGSKHNISQRLMSLIRCNDYAISTDGGALNFCHPDRKTLAVILRGVNSDKSKPINFYFNYPIAEIESRTGALLTEEEKKKEAENCNMLEKGVVML